MSKKDLEFNKNEDVNKQLWDAVQAKLIKIEKGGGEKSALKQKAKGKLLARERVDYLRDKNSNWIEIGAFASQKTTAIDNGDHYILNGTKN